MTDTRTLGRSGLEVIPLGLGSWPLGGAMASGDQPLGYAGVDSDEAVRAVRRGVELGANLIDTADAYGAGRSERLLAPVLDDNPDVLIATKFGLSYDEETSQITGEDVSPDAIRAACHASLRRLGRERIDLYQLHTPHITAEQAAEVLAVLEALVDQGDVAWYGVSTDEVAEALPFVGGGHLAALQIELNVLDDHAEILDFCEREDLAVLCRSPLAMGLLGGRYSADSRMRPDDIRGHQPEWLRWFVDGRPSADYLERLDSVRGELSADGRTLAQGALAWIWARSALTIPLPGFRNVDQLEQNMAALEFGPLSAERFDAIESALGRA
jgi:aryl-alcohol dehydrogenase-like predicted oxidoreductase